MGKYRVDMVNNITGEVEELEEFNTYEEAEAYRDEAASDFSAGADVLELANRPFTDPDDVEFEINEV